MIFVSSPIFPSSSSSVAEPILSSISFSITSTKTTYTPPRAHEKCKITEAKCWKCAHLNLEDVHTSFLGEFTGSFIADIRILFSFLMQDALLFLCRS